MTTIDEIITKWIAADYQMSALTRDEQRMLEDEIEDRAAAEAAEWANQPAGN